MTRGRGRVLHFLRLTVYLAALLLVVRSTGAAPPDRMAVSMIRERAGGPADAPPYHFAGAMLVVLLAGVLLEIRAGVARWR